MLLGGGKNDVTGAPVNPIFQSVLATALLASLFARPASAQGNAVYVVTYVEVLPNATTSGAALLKGYRDASRNEDGNLRFDVLHEIARLDRFAILEIWTNQAALDGHIESASALHFRDSLKVIQSAPYDTRVGNNIDSAPEKSGHLADAI